MKKDKRKRTAAPWSPFKPAAPIAVGLEGVDSVDVFLNSRYQVNVYDAEVADGFPPTVQLSIKRLDKRQIREWRDLQRIKDELCGRDCEAVEVFPAASRLVDTSNQYHLWVLPPGLRFPLGLPQAADDLRGKLRFMIDEAQSLDPQRDGMLAGKLGRKGDVQSRIVLPEVEGPFVPDQRHPAHPSPS